ncbi:MAG: OmpA family protein, partial [Roseovarius sp.]|nr:OmpA family protein [Roseovarius sp.]
LVALAAFLRAAPATRVALVGHTDSTGGLEPNSALSRARAEAVLTRLIEQHGVAPAQVEAHGIGYLAPIAPNTSPEGRERNRRVEVVLLSAGEP